MPNELRFDWPGIHPASLGGEGGGLAGAKLLANLLALPEETYQERVGASQMRAVARSMGVPEDQLDIVAPGTDVPQPVGGTGILGKIMSGVGKTGATLSAMLGAPVKAPRFGPTELKDMETGAAQQSLIGTLDPNDPDYAKKAAKIRLGKYDDVFPHAPKNIMELASAEADRRQLSGADRYNFIRDEVVRMTQQQTQARTDVTTQADIDKKNAEIDKQNEAIREWNKNHPEAQRPEMPHLSLGGGGGGTASGGGGRDQDNIPNRHNNPGNIKDGPFARSQAGYVGTGASAADGGAFATFDTPEHGNQAMQNLLTSPHYRNLTIDAGLRRWSNGGYGGDVAQSVGLDPNQTIGSLNPQQLGTLQTAMSKREGWSGGSGAKPAPPGQPQPTQVATNVPPGTTTDVGGAETIGIPPDAVTDQKGNVYNRTDLTKPLGTVVPGKPGQMIKAKETLGPAGVTTETVDPRAKWLQNEQRNLAVDQLRQRQAQGEAGVNADDPQQIYDQMAANSHGMRGFTEADAAFAAVGLKPGQIPNPEQARQILQILKNKGGETGPQAALARIALQRADNALLLAPVEKTDPQTGQVIRDANGNVQYAMWTDPRDGKRKPIRPIDTLIPNWVVAHMPYAAQINIQQQMNDPDYHLAATRLNQAQSNLTRFATLKGDAKRIADTERQRMQTLVPLPSDTPQQALDKITETNAALDRMEVQARHELGLEDVISPASPGAGGQPPATAAAPAPAGKPRQLKHAPKGFTIEPMGQQ